MFGCNPVAFQGFLYGFVVGPGVEFFLFQDFYGGLPLFGQGGGVVPGYHHFDVVFVGIYLEGE